MKITLNNQINACKSRRASCSAYRWVAFVLLCVVALGLTARATAQETQALPPPANLTATISDGKATLSWSAVSNANGYVVLQSSTSGGPYSFLAYPASGATSYTAPGLQNGTSYYYVVQSYNGGGYSTNSNEITVSPTLSAPVLSVASTGDGTATLSWSAASNADGYIILRSTTSGGPYSFLAYPSSSATSYTDSGLLNGASYYYVVQSYNAGGYSANSNEVKVSPTLSAPILSVSSIGDGSATVSWSAVSNADGYIILRSTTSGGPYGFLAYSASNVTSHTDTGLQNGTSYYYVVQAYNNGGYSTNSNEIAISPTLNAPILSLESTGDGTATISWSAVSNADGIVILRSTSSGGPYSVLAYPSSSATSYTDNGLQNRTTYCYVVQSYNAGGCSTDSNQLVVSLSLAPPSLNVSATGDGTATLSWSSVSNGDGYELCRSTASGGPYNHLAYINSGTTSFTDAGLQNGTSYYYVVKSYNNGGFSTNSNEVSVSPTINAPVLSLLSTGNGTAVLTWSSVSNADGYELCRSTTSGGPYSHLAYINSGATSFTDTGLQDGAVYYYVAKSYNAGGFSAYSNEISSSSAASTPSGPPPAPTGLTAQPGDQQVALSWTAVVGATGYTVKGSAVSGGPYTNITYAGVVRGTTFTNQYLTNGTTYYYVVTAVNSSGESANSNEASATPVGPPAAPTTLVAQPGYQQVTLTWTASAVTDSYNIYRGTNPGGENAAPINTAPITSTNFTDVGLTSGTTYYYTVVAVNSYGESPQSNEASATLVLPPDSPAALIATPDTGQVVLSWTAPPGSVTSYTVQRAMTTGGPYTTLATGSSTSYTDTAVVNGTPYFYIVFASNLSGPGVASDEAMAEPFVSPAAPSVTPSYGYDSGGMRAWKSIGGSTTYFLYDGSQPVCELDASGNVLATNTWGGGLLSRHAGSASTFYTFDPSGNVAQRLDSSGNVLGAYAFDAFGLRTGTDATTDPYSSFGGQYGYYADAESGLLLLGHRYYDAGTGRFINRDPLGYAGGTNLYAYAGNNPVMLADPSGFCPDNGGPGSGGSNGGGYDPTNPFGPDGTGDPNGPLTGKSGNPGFNPGSPQNNDVNNMEAGFGDSLKMAVGGAALGMAGAALRGLGEAAEAGENTTLYRGVSVKHEGFFDALDGIATPRGGPGTLENYTYNDDIGTEYTAWTTDPNTAQAYALRGQADMGVVLSKQFSTSEMSFYEGDTFGDNQVFIKGQVTDADVTVIQR